MEIFEDERTESSHSGFIAWLLKDAELLERYDSPLYRLLHLAYQRSNQQNCDISNRIATLLFNQVFHLENLHVYREYPIRVDPYGDGRLDIYIQCRVSGQDIFVIIENKVKSGETIKYDTNKNALYQSDAYCKWIDNQYPDALRILIFLSPISQKELDQLTLEGRMSRCRCKDFIHINYQDILDYIIQPLLIDEISPISARNRTRLKEYKKALGKPSKEYDFNTVMAMSLEERQLLIHFYESNRELILAALEAKAADPDADEDEQTELINLKSSVQKASRPRSYFSIMGQGKYRMFDATKQFVQELEKRSVGIQEIVSSLKSCDIKLLTETEYQDLRSDDLRGRFSLFSVYGLKYYLQKGYAYNKTDKLKNPNFPLLIKMANEKFQITIDKIE